MRPSRPTRSARSSSISSDDLRATAYFVDERQVGVREARRNLSTYLRRVERTERLEVTDRGRFVALLSPLPAADGVLKRSRNSAKTGSNRALARLSRSILIGHDPVELPAIGDAFQLVIPGIFEGETAPRGEIFHG